MQNMFQNTTNFSKSFEAVNKVILKVTRGLFFFIGLVSLVLFVITGEAHLFAPVFMCAVMVWVLNKELKNHE